MKPGRNTKDLNTFKIWIIMAWQHISPEVTVKGFNKCCISSAADGADNDMLWNDSIEEY
jgi:hypothetical protein